MEKLKLIVTGLLLVSGGIGQAVAQNWVDYTSKISDPSFEKKEAASTLKDRGWDTGEGWTITPSSGVKNGQSGIANASTVIQGIGSQFNPAAGDKFMYLRCNWNKDTEFKISQTITGDLPAGTYRLSCKVANSTSNYDASTYKLSLGDGTQTATNNFAFNKSSWGTCSIVFYKSDGASNLNIEAYMKPGADGGGHHYCLLLDDFKLEYMSNSDLDMVSPEKPLDLSAAISNATIYNETNTKLPKGWTELAHTAGNSNRTQGTGDTQLEGWSGGGKMNVNYCQELTNLPNGIYILKAKVHDSAGAGAVLYATSSKNTGIGEMSKDYSVVSSKEVNVTDHNLTIGIKGENINATWMTGDDFAIYYVESNSLNVLVPKAKKLLEDENYKNVTGTERTALSNVLNSSPTVETLRKAMADFKAVKTSYDNWDQTWNEEKNTAEKLGITKEILTSAAEVEKAVQRLNVAEFNAVESNYTTAIELGNWTTSGAANFNNEHWSGNQVNYLNQDDSNGKGWNSDHWTMTCSQDITLPAGEYVFKAAGRKSPDARLILKVADGANSLGEVANFPSTNKALGISKAGKASFDNTTDAFANGNNGYGWQWRFVAFTLTEETKVSISIEAGANLKYNWASFGDYCVLAKPNTGASLAAYNQAVTSAQEAKTNCAVVIGSELTELDKALAADKGNTVESIDAATETIKTCTKNLTDAAPKYQTLVDAKALQQEALPYALASKLALFNEAKEAVPTSGADAETKAKAIIAARRAYVESNGKAEGVEGAVDCTDKIVNPQFADALNGWSHSQEGGSLKALEGETWTNADGTKGGKYFDYYNDAANNQHGYQEITGLTPGRYIVTAKVRAQADFNLFILIDGKSIVDIDEIGNQGGVFDRGWNDYTTEVQVGKDGKFKFEVANIPAQNQKGWFGFGDVRLYRIGDLKAIVLDENADNSAALAAQTVNVFLKRTIVPGVWNTLVLPFSLTDAEVKAAFGAETQIATFSNVEDNKVNFLTSSDGIDANVPVLIKAAAGKEFTFNGVTLLEGDPVVTGNAFLFKGSYAAETDLAEGDYMLSGDKWWQNAAADNYHVKGFRAYLQAINPEAGNAKKLQLSIDGETTGISQISTTVNHKEGETYNLAGQKVSASYKGIVIRNGKKVVKK